MSNGISELANRRNRNGINLSHHPLSALIRCSTCNAPYYYRHFKAGQQLAYNHHTDTPKQRQCKSLPRYLKKEIEQLFELTLYMILGNEDTIQAFLRNYTEQMQDKHQSTLSNIASLESERGKLNKLS